MASEQAQNIEKFSKENISNPIDIPKNESISQSRMKNDF